MKILRYLLSKKEKKRLFEELSHLYNYINKERDNIKKLKVEKIIVNNETELILIDSFPSFFKTNNKYYPTLHLIARIIENKGIDYVKKSFKYVAVDSGALRPLLRGADVMKPGIKETSGFKKDDVVVVFLIDKWIPIVIGTAITDYDEHVDKGKTIKNIHRIGDRIWDLSERIIKTTSR